MLQYSVLQPLTCESIMPQRTIAELVAVLGPADPVKIYLATA